MMSLVRNCVGVCFEAYFDQSVTDCIACRTSRTGEAGSGEGAIATILYGLEDNCPSHGVLNRIWRAHLRAILAGFVPLSAMQKEFPTQGC
jgi:hypothetical protein